MYVVADLCGYRVDIRFLGGYGIWKSDGLIISPLVHPLFFSLIALLDADSERCAGLPSTALCMWGSALANVASFALIFPAVRFFSPHPFFS